MTRSALFLTELQVKELGQDRWALIAPLRYRSLLLNHIVTVPTGFVTDFESIPRWLPISYAILYGSAHAAAVVHDYLYRFQFTSRTQADGVWYEAILATGQPRWKAWLLWLGVRLGGWWKWRHYARKYQ